MERDPKLKRDADLFDRYSDEINAAYRRAVREALLRHKRAGNRVAVEREGELVLLSPDEIAVDE